MIRKGSATPRSRAHVNEVTTTARQKGSNFVNKPKKKFRRVTSRFQFVLCCICLILG